ncbi:small secreted [Fusarium albosuccineum]|uniref:Small secreted n=1 Tax=Fusarium albosuccineum TaxID=1237068 RepID=A0A8H4NUL3_9HYPO|nr:small secreted [Fusarium albosuccineum]
MFAHATLTLLLATTALAASNDIPDFKSMPEPVATGNGWSEKLVKAQCTAENQTGELWTVKNLKRYCNPKDTECTWKYQIATKKTANNPYHCVYTIKSKNGVPASKVTTYDGDGIHCGVFHITQEYFLPQQQGAPPYTVICANHPSDNRRIFAGFDDTEYANGHTAKDKTYCVELP